jgi:hypothetical protein
LRAVLNDALEAARRIDGHSAFVNVVAARLFNIDILSRLAGPDGHQRMPVIGRGDRDGIEVLVIERLANVGDHRWLISAVFDFGLGPHFEQARVGIDQVGDFYILHLRPLADVRSAAAVDAGHADTDGLIGAKKVSGGLGAVDQHSGAGGREGRFDEMTTRKT